MVAYMSGFLIGAGVCIVSFVLGIYLGKLAVEAKKLRNKNKREKK